MAYKKLIKVSNVCQLLDKSKYPATQTINGVTFTNNGDGSITIDGTATGSYYSLYTIKVNIDSVISGHKYAILGTGTNIQCVIIGNYAGGYIFKNSNSIYTFPKHEYTRIVYEIRVLLGFNFSNVIIKPQLFDLTEMYGAGHEPTTVEQFRQDFPEEMYDYSPYCWLTSYKRVFMTGGGNYLTSYERNLTCKTKNLFNISKVTQANDLKVIGNSLYSYGYPAVSDDTSTLSIFKSLKPNTNYTMSAITNYLGDSSTNITLVFNNGSIDLLANYTDGFIHTTFSLTQEQIDNINAVYFYGKSESQGGPVIWSNIQIEEGDIATDYVPYGHL